MLTVLEGLHSASGLYKIVQLVHLLYLAFCSPMKEDLHKTPSPTFLILMWADGNPHAILQ
jgi:hypothetical protein